MNGSFTHIGYHTDKGRPSKTSTTIKKWFETEKNNNDNNGIKVYAAQ